MFKAVRFDVDNCWAAATEVGEPLFAPAFDASRRANHGTVSEEALCEACAECWRHPLDWVATQDGFSETMVAAGWTVLAATAVTAPIHGYGDPRGATGAALSRDVRLPPAAGARLPWPGSTAAWRSFLRIASGWNRFWRMTRFRPKRSNLIHYD